MSVTQDRDPATAAGEFVSTIKDLATAVSAHSNTHSQGGGDEVQVENLGTSGGADTVPKSDGGGGVQMGNVDHSEVTGVGADDHHARDHASRHSQGGADEVTVENLGTGGGANTVPKSDGGGGLAMGSVDHSELSGVGTDDHHAQDHQTRHQAGGADEIAQGSLQPQDPTAHGDAAHTRAYVTDLEEARAADPTIEGDIEGGTNSAFEADDVVDLADGGADGGEDGKAAISSDAQVLGYSFVQDVTNGETALVFLGGSAQTVEIIHESTNVFTTTEDNDGTTNIYFDATNGRYEINNETGAIATYAIEILKA